MVDTITIPIHLPKRIESLCWAPCVHHVDVAVGDGNAGPPSMMISREHINMMQSTIGHGRRTFTAFQFFWIVVL